MRIAVFGGSFDPIHIGHLYIAEEARTALGYDRIIFFPSNVPPHKQPSQKVSVEDRIRMVQLAISGNPAFSVDEFEVAAGGVSFTIRTVHHVLSTYDVSGKPGLIIGDDLLPGFATWKNASEINNLAELIVARRSSQRSSNADASSLLYRSIQNVLVPVSSSDIRHRIVAGQSFRYLVPESVYAYISQKRLYRD